MNISVSLHDAGFPVAATTNSVVFNGEVLSLSASDCAVNPAIGKRLTAAPVGGSESDATFRFHIVSASNTQRIGDGVLFTCRFMIAPGAIPGRYALTVDAKAAFGPSGAEVERVLGENGSVTVSLVPRACAGDCNGDLAVTVGEVILGVAIAGGRASLSECLPMDLDGDGAILIGELIAAVGSLLDGCP